MLVFLFDTSGTIPANTGRIFGYRNRGGACADHPREYGEN